MSELLPMWKEGEPAWADDVPFCDERCPQHDGKRCRLLGERPGRICEPAVSAMAEALRESRTHWSY